jgi:uncharacterized membrane protein
VLERVIRHEQRVGQTVEVEDEKLRGEQTLAFEAQPEDRTRVVLTFDYSLKNPAPLSVVTDLLFIRRAVRESMQRTLARFARERRGDAELLGS